MMLHFRNFVLLVLFFSSVVVYAGGPDKEALESARKNFPHADAMFLQKKASVTIELVEGELKVNSFIDEQLFFATEQSDFYRKYALYHSYFTEITNLGASTFSNTNGKFKEVEVEDFVTSDNVGGNIFYDDSKEVSFLFPAVTAGSVGKVSYKQTLRDPHFMHPFYFSSYMPVINSEYTVTCPSSVKLRFRVMNDDSKQIQFSREEKGKNTIYRWKAENVKERKAEDGSPGYAHYAPHVLVTIGEYTYNGKTIPLIPDLNGLCEWYKTFVKDINKEEDSTLSATVVSLVKDVSADEEKIKRIYYWVQDNINYIAFEDGMNGFVPREAKAIYKQRYGDCKDMSSLLVTMLRKAGIKAYHTWIGTRRLPYSYSDLACPNIDDHMICVADAGGKRYVLDGTGKYTPMGFVTEFIQGKEALVLKDDGQCEVYRIPVMPKEKSVVSDTITVHFDADKQLTGEIETSFDGYYRIDQAYTYHYTRPEKREETFRNMLKTGNNKCRITDIRYEGFNGQDSIVRIQARYELPEYFKSVGNKIYINPNLEKTGEYEAIDLEERTLPLEMEYKNIKKSTTIINIPEGYALDYKPDNVSFKGKNGTFEITYHAEANRLIQTKTIETDVLMIPLSEIPEWNNMIHEIGKAYKENIVLIKK